MVTISTVSTAEARKVVISTATGPVVVTPLILVHMNGMSSDGITTNGRIMSRAAI
jgi:hypothetical protein